MARKKRTRKRRNGEGSVLYRKDRRAWYVRYFDSDGTRKKAKAEDCSSEAEAKIFLKDLLKRNNEEQARREGKLSNEMLVPDIQENYLNALRTEVCSKHLANVKNRLDKIINQMGFMNIVDITLLKIDTYRSERLKQKARGGSRTISKETVNKETGSLSAMLTWAEGHSLIESNPIARMKALNIKKHERVKVRRSLTPAEVEKLLNPTNSSDGLDLIWATFLGTGLRKNELSETTWRDIDFDHTPALLTVRSEVSKNDEEDVLPLPAELTRRLLEHRKRAELRRELSGKLFVTRSGASIYRGLLERFKVCIKKTKINPAGVDIHSLRKTFITDLIRQGVPVKIVQRLARHKTITLTLNLYAEVYPCDLADGIEHLSWFKNSDVGPPVGPQKDRKVG